MKQINHKTHDARLEDALRQQAGPLAGDVPEALHRDIMHALPAGTAPASVGTALFFRAALAVGVVAAVVGIVAVIQVRLHHDPAPLVVLPARPAIGAVGDAARLAPAPETLVQWSDAMATEYDNVLSDLRGAFGVLSALAPSSPDA